MRIDLVEGDEKLTLLLEFEFEEAVRFPPVTQLNLEIVDLTTARARITGIPALGVAFGPMNMGDFRGRLLTAFLRVTPIGDICELTFSFWLGAVKHG